MLTSLNPNHTHTLPHVAIQRKGREEANLQKWWRAKCSYIDRDVYMVEIMKKEAIAKSFKLLLKISSLRVVEWAPKLPFCSKWVALFPLWAAKTSQASTRNHYRLILPHQMIFVNSSRLCNVQVAFKPSTLTIYFTQIGFLQDLI